MRKHDKRENLKYAWRQSHTRVSNITEQKYWFTFTLIERVPRIMYRKLLG